MSAGTCQPLETLGLHDAQAAQQRALQLMQEAIKLLDQARQPFAAAHLQHAIDTLHIPAAYRL